SFYHGSESKEGEEEGSKEKGR
ncbi:MAG: hypothetical protein QOD95_47, partial [Gammaproteobacteria bacterium]|nr:hypothetical protein [Gammaproteobacteria bacterium]